MLASTPVLTFISKFFRSPINPNKVSASVFKVFIQAYSRKNSRTILFFNLAVDVFIPHIIDGAASTTHDKSSRCKYRQRVEWGQDSRGCGKSNTPTTRPEQQPRPCANIASSQNIVNYLVLLNRIEQVLIFLSQYLLEFTSNILNIQPISQAFPLLHWLECLNSTKHRSAKF